MGGMIALPQRHLVQPQYTPSVDFSSPLLNGVSSSIITIGGTDGWGKNLGRNIAQPSHSGGYASRVTERGLALDFNGSDTYVEYAIANVPYVEFTLLWGGVIDSFGNFPGLVDCTVSGVSGWNIFQAGSDTLWFSADGYSGILSSSSWPTGTFVHGALRNKYLSDCTWFRNGVSVATTSGVNPGAPTVPLRVGTQRGGGSTFWDGGINYFYLFDKYLSDSQIASVSANPWQIFKAPATRIFVPAAGSGSTGTVDVTNANDTSSASGTTTVTGSSAKTGADDTSSASGTTTVIGSSAQTSADDTSSASGTTTVVGSSAGTGADDTSSASGSVGSGVFGTVAYTGLDDTSSASGTTTVTGSSSSGSSNDTSSASGTTTVIGSAAATNANDISSASGVAGEVSGSVAATNSNDTVVARGSAGIQEVAQYSGGYAYISREDREAHTKQQRIAMGIIEDDTPNSILEKYDEILVVQPKQKKAKQVDREAQLKAEIKFYLAEIEKQKEDEAIVKMLMEM